VDAMQEKGIDMAFRNPRSIATALMEFQPDIIITMGCGEECPFVPGAKVNDWDLPDPGGASIELMRHIRDEIEQRVVQLINYL
jgi:protein-tyrosine-phosphatase